MSAREHARQQSGSFLVRCWVERGEVEDQPEVLRVYVRNLRSGEEYYIGGLAEVGQLLQRALDESAEGAAGTGDLTQSEVG